MAALLLQTAGLAPRQPTRLWGPTPVEPELAPARDHRNYRGEYDLELVCAPRWIASSLTVSVRSICVKVRVIES